MKNTYKLLPQENVASEDWISERNNPQELDFSKLEKSAGNVKLEKVLGSFPDVGEKKLKFMSYLPDLGE